MNLAYVAGFFDGEGCAGFCRMRQSIYPRVLITNTNRSILEEIQRTFGGDIKLALRHSGWKQGYSLCISWSAAVYFLGKVQPYLRLKSRQAETIFAWDAIRLGRGKSSKVRRAEYTEAVELLRERMTWLNKKGDGVDSSDPIDAIALSTTRGGKKKPKPKEKY